MQDRKQLTEQYLQIMQAISSKINRKEFCWLIKKPLHIEAALV